MNFRSGNCAVLGAVIAAGIFFGAAPVVGQAAAARPGPAIAAMDAISADDWLKQPSGALLDRVIAASSKDALDAAARKDPRAQALVGSAHLAGVHGYVKGEAEAANFYRLAAGSNPIAQNNLASMLLSGTANGGKPAPAEAVEMFQRAARQGHPVAQYNLGLLYRDGSGVAKDEARAAEYFTLAAAQGNVAAQKWVDDRKKMEEWAQLEARAAAGDADALYAIAESDEELDDGTDEAYSVIQSSYQEALNAYLPEARAGNAHAMRRVAGMYYDGRGTKRDLALAFVNYQGAASAGDAFAQYMLGRMLEKGQGVAANKAEAIRQYQRSARQGETAAQKKLQELGESW